MKTLTSIIIIILLTGCLSFHQGPIPGEPKNATFFQIDDTRVRYFDSASIFPQAKDFETIVLIHGYASSLEEWSYLIPKLMKNNYRVVTMDLRGHGWTDRPDGDYSIESQAKLVIEVINKLSVDKFYIAGHSWGSAVSLKITMTIPERVKKIILYNGMYFNDQQPVVFEWSRVPILGEFIYSAFYLERQDEKMAFAFYDAEPHITEYIVERLELFTSRPGTLASLLAGIRAMDFEKLEPHYKDISQPVLLIWGREDQVTPIEYGERMLHKLPNSQLKIIPRCGHLPMVEAHSVTSNFVINFIKEDKS